MCSIGPRQMTGWSSWAKKPIEMQRTPCVVGGTIMSSITVGGCSTPSMRGIEKPHTSASTTATDLPCCARAMARLAVTDDLPTPPLPDAMSRVRVRLPAWANGMARPSAWPWAAWDPAVAAGLPWTSSRTLARCSSVMTPKSMLTRLTPSRAWTASVTSVWIWLRNGQPAMVRSMPTSTWPPSMAVERTIPRSTMLRWSSGSCTGRRASMTAASVTDMGSPGRWVGARTARTGDGVEFLLRP